MEIRKLPNTVATIEEWVVGVPRTKGFFQARKNQKPVLIGKIFDKEKAKTVTIKTSVITSYNKEENVFVSAKGNKYKLGSPNPQYVECFPSDIQSDLQKYLNDSSNAN